MKSNLYAVFAAFVLIQSSYAAIVTVTGITGHNGGNWPSTLGHLTDMVNANGSNNFGSGDHNPGLDITADVNDPSTWVNNSGTWQSEWLGDGRLDPTSSANNKIGWVVMDFGTAVANLENMYIWNGRYSSPGEETRNYNIYYSNGVGINSLPTTPNSRTWAGGSAAAADYNFGVGDWTQIGSTATLGTPGGSYTPDATISLGGITAQYVAIEILTAENGTIPDRVGLAQVEFTAIPEPSAALLGALGVIALMRRRR